MINTAVFIFYIVDFIFYFGEIVSFQEMPGLIFTARKIK